MPLTPDQNRRRADQQRGRRLRNRGCANPYCVRPATAMLVMKGQSVALCATCHSALEDAGTTDRVCREIVDSD